MSREVHDLVCGAYAELAPRPSRFHRICILFPADEKKTRVVWVPTNDRKAMRPVVAPSGFNIKMSGGPRVEYDGETGDYRQLWLVCVDMYAYHPELPKN